MFSGSYVAIVTPFCASDKDKAGKVDYKKLKELSEFQIENSTDGIVVCGSTGESATLSYEEHEFAIETVVKAVKGKVKVIAGTGSNNTTEAIILTKFAKKVGADGALLVSPYYNKPTQKGLYLHFKEIADTIDIPIVLYNIQSRTAVNIEPETIAKLVHDCKNIVSVKEASGSIDQMTRIKQLCPKIELTSGDDALTLPVMSIGGVGVISVIANIVPKDVSDMVHAYAEGNFKKAMELNYKLYPITKAMFIETNPIPIKTAMEMLGMCSGELRLPLCSMGEENVPKVRKSLRDYGLLK